MTDRKSFSFRLLLAAIILAICLGTGTARAGLVDKVVAVVNGEVITRTELEQAGKEVFVDIRHSLPPAEQEEKLEEARQRILDRMIEDLLIAQKAEELRLGVSEEEIDNAIAAIGANNNITVAELYGELERTGVAREEYRRKLAAQIRRSKVLSYEIQSKIVISEEDAREYYDEVFSRKDTPRGYQLLQIGINREGPESSETDGKVRERIEGIRKLAVEGQSFRELAKAFSELPSAKEGGDIGFFTAEEMAPAMRKIITALEPGRISEIIESGNSLQFFQLLVRNLNGTPEFAPFQEVKEGIVDRLRQQELETRYEEWLREIREQAIIKKLI